MSFERKLHLRLPLAGSLHEVHGQEGFSLLLCVDSPVLLAGTGLDWNRQDRIAPDRTEPERIAVGWGGLIYAAQ